MLNEKWEKKMKKPLNINQNPVVAPNNVSVSDLEQEKRLRLMYEELLHLLNNEVTTQNDSKVLSEKNNAVIQDTMGKHSDIMSVPQIMNAVQSFLSENQGRCLQTAGFPQAMEVINAVFQAGYNAGVSLKNSNEGAKNRLKSSVQKQSPDNSGKIYTRAEIANMSPDVFAKYEKEIFSQFANGLIK